MLKVRSQNNLIAYINMACGQDELVFNENSMVMYSVLQVKFLKN